MAARTQDGRPDVLFIATLQGDGIGAVWTKGAGRAHKVEQLWASGSCRQGSKREGSKRAA